MEEQNFSTRLKKAIEYYKLSNNQLTAYMKASNGYIGKILSGGHQPTLDKVESILWAMPKVSADWLVLGVGNMLRENVTFPINENEAPVETPGNESGSISNSKKLLPDLEQMQLNESSVQYQSLSIASQQQIEKLKTEVKSLKGVIQTQEMTIRMQETTIKAYESAIKAQEVTIDTLKNAQFQAKVSMLETAQP